MSNNVEELEKGIEKIHLLIEKIGASKKMLERKVVSFGNGGHIVIPKEYLNRKAKIILE